MLADNASEKIVVVAPVGQDATVMVELLNAQGFRAETCTSPEQLHDRINEGVGALVLTEEALELRHIENLLETLHAQAPWSELPLIILSNAGESRVARLLDLAASAAGSITLLERPIGTTTLLRSVEVALRSRRRQYQVRQLLEDKARLAAIVEYSEDAIISKDPQGIIITWNRGAERLFGYAASEAMGKPITILVPPERLEEEMDILRRIGRGERVEPFETKRIDKNGKILDISLTVSPLVDGSGKIVGASTIARDETARKAAEQALAEAQEKLEQHAARLEKIVAERTHNLQTVNDQLEAFVYSIAHDLRAPLRAMIGYSQMLTTEYKAQLEEMPQFLLQRIQSSSEFMDKLLLDLLAYGRTARAEMPLEVVDPRKVWESALFQCATQIEQTKANIETQGPFPAVQAHEATLGQVFANLLSNALKFIPPGVLPHIRFWSEDHASAARFWIEDNGIGIEPAHVERVFRVFERLNGSRYSGTGVGLSIVRKGVERMGGKVGLESEVGKGSRFWIELQKAA